MYSGLNRCSSTHRGWPAPCDPPRCVWVGHHWASSMTGRRPRNDAVTARCHATARGSRGSIVDVVGSVATKQKRLIGAHLVRTAPSKRGSSKFFEPTKRPKSCQAMAITRFSLVELLGVTVSIFCFQKIQSQMPAFTNVYSHEVLSFLVAETLDSDYISMGFIHRKKTPIFVCLGSGFSASPWKSKGFPGTRCSPPWISRLIYKYIYISIYLVP